MQNKLLVVTGGLGFIGKNFIEFVKEKYEEIIVIDKNSTHSDIAFYKKIIHKNIQLIESDIADVHNFKQLLPIEFDLVNFAAESHVDRSFLNSIDFSYSNYISTHKLLEFIRVNNLKPRIIHISTDEVYGTVFKNAAKEDHKISPTNPYSVSKAAADLLCQTYKKCYGLDIIIVRPNNIYGPFQHIEKLIPASINAALGNKKLVIHGDGSPKRSFLNVVDFSKAILILLETKWDLLEHSIFNITSSNEYSVVEIVNMIAEISGVTNKDSFASFGSDRPFNDLRYYTDCSRLSNLGWSEEEDFYSTLKIIYEHNQVFLGSE